MPVTRFHVTRLLRHSRVFVTWTDVPFENRTVIIIAFGYTYGYRENGEKPPRRRRLRPSKQ